MLNNWCVVFSKDKEDKGDTSAHIWGMVNYSKPHSPPNSEDDAGINIIYQLPRIFPAQREQFYKDGMFAKVGRKHMEV